MHVRPVSCSSIVLIWKFDEADQPTTRLSISATDWLLKTVCSRSSAPYVLTVRFATRRSWTPLARRSSEPRTLIHARRILPMLKL